MRLSQFEDDDARSESRVQWRKNMVEDLLRLGNESMFPILYSNWPRVVGLATEAGTIKVSAEIQPEMVREHPELGLSQEKLAAKYNASREMVRRIPGAK